MMSALSVSPEPCAAVALGVMVAGWIALYCVLCPPARAAGDAVITDVGWAWVATGAPIVRAASAGVWNPRQAA